MDTILIFKRTRVITKTGKSRVVWVCKINGIELKATTMKMLKTLVREHLEDPLSFI
jgi:hypothetical protein